nr:NfeD family protein [Methylobacterium sp. BTF04]
MALMGAELALPGVFLLWFGLAALVTGLEIAMIPMPWQAQLVMFAILAVGFVVLAVRRQKGQPNALNRGAHGLIGREVRLDQPIADGLGRLRIDDTLWRVAGADAPEGARVRITGVAGTVLLVEPA